MVISNLNLEWILMLSHYHKLIGIFVWTAFSSMIEGKNEEMSTSELSGGARIHYIFQNIFVKSLEVPIDYTSFLEISLLFFEFSILHEQSTSNSSSDIKINQ